MSIFHAQPFKGLYVLFAVAVNAIRLPLWLILYLPSFNRPSPKWSYRQTIAVQIVKNFLYTAATIHMRTPLSLLPKVEKERWAVVKPSDHKHYTGVAICDPEIKPDSVGGTWYPAKPSKTGKPGLVILHLHGGAYVIGDGRTQDAGFAAKTLLANTDATHVFAPQYRLSSNPGGRFPAALQDAVTAYAYLIHQEGIPANKIILSGDSAGANLVLALTKYLTEYGTATGLEGPLCDLLWSPWVNPNKSLDEEAFDRSPNKDTDYITADFGLWGASTFIPNKKSGLTLDSPYISFGGNPFKTSTPIYISTGECEVLFHDDVELAEEMKAVAGNKITLQIEDRCVHDTILIGHLLGFVKEANLGAKRAGDYIRQVSSGAKL